MSRENIAEVDRVLRCPQTGQTLQRMSLQSAEEVMGGELGCVRPEGSVDGTGHEVVRLDQLEEVLVRSDQRVAYPVISRVPILLIPEQLALHSDSSDIDVSREPYLEAYSEMAFYNSVAHAHVEDFLQSNSYRAAKRVENREFLDLEVDWLDATYDCAAQLDAYRHIGRVRGGVICQLGGKGGHAVKFALAGAARCWSVTPMLGEALCAAALAEKFGVSSRVFPIVAMAEQLPFAEDELDAAFSGGCLHHMNTRLVASELVRTLKKGGRFGATDPWRAPLYSVGTRLLGKREREVHCVPLTSERTSPFDTRFRQVQILQHGTFTRYALLALQKGGLELRLEWVLKIFSYDDRVARRLGRRVRGAGSSVAVLATK